MKIFQNNYSIFFLLLFTNSLLLFLSFNGFWTISHGPLYYLIAEGLYDSGKLISNILVIPGENDIFTIQIGISFFIYLGLLIFGKNLWYIFIIFLISLVWYYCYFSIYNFTKKINIKEISFPLFALIFFQPYNLNQIACFSNESIYFPFLIISFFTIIKLFNDEKIGKIEILITLFIFLLGTFFRVHNIIYIFSLFIFSIYLKRFNLLFIWVFFFLIKLIIISWAFKYTNVQYSIPLIKEVAQEILNQLNNIVNPNKLNFITAKSSELYFIKATNALSTFSFYLFINKFLDNIYFKFIITFFVFLFFLFILKKNILHYKNKNFYIFGIIFSTLSSIFVFLIPMFEYNYLLPSSFFIIINYYLYFKNYLKEKFNKYLIIFSIIYIIIFVVIFIGIVKVKNVEIYKYRIFFHSLKKNLGVIKYSDLVYFDDEDNNINFQEFYRWFISQKICNFKITPDECAKLRNIDLNNRLFVIKTNEQIIDINKFVKYRIKKITEFYYEFEKK